MILPPLIFTGVTILSAGHQGILAKVGLGATVVEHLLHHLKAKGFDCSDRGNANVLKG